MKVLKSRFIRKVGILGFSLTIAIVSILVINTRYNLLSQVGGYLAGSPLFIDNKFCDDPGKLEQQNCTSFIPKFISNAAAAGASPYQTITEGNVSIAGEGTGVILLGSAATSLDKGYSGISLNGTLSLTNYNLLSGTGDQRLYINRPSGKDIRFRMNNTDQMILDSNGRLGIGTATPGRPLEVNNTMKFTNTGTDANDGVIGVAGWQPGLNIVGVQTDGDGRKIYVFGYTTFGNGHGDLAENYFVSGKVIRGSLASINDSTPSTVTASDSSHKILLGIVTTNPGAVMDTEGGFHIGETTKPRYINEKTPIALIGTVPALVTLQNGLISIGDPIGLSSLPGFGAKATTAGTIAGKALEAFNPNNALCQNASSLDAIKWPEDNGKNPQKPCFKLPDGTYVGKIMVAVNVTWYDPATLDDTNISAKLDKQQQEIDQLKQEIQELKNK